MDFLELGVYGTDDVVVFIIAIRSKEMYIQCMNSFKEEA